MNMWNIIGIVAWLIVLGFFLFVIWNIRYRHIKAIVRNGRPLPLQVIGIDLIEVLGLVALVWGMSWVTWLRPVNYEDTASVAVSHSAKPLILQTGADQSYYVQVKTGNGKSPTLYFTYWTEGAKYQTTSFQATLSTGNQPLTPQAAAYPWSKAMLRNLDKTADRAYVATMTARYKPTFINGLGLRVGRVADRFSILRVPNDTLVEIQPK